VELVFSAFNTNRTPHIPGTLETIAADRTVDENRQAYYKVRAKVTAERRQLMRTRSSTSCPACPWSCSSRLANAP
jgi:protease secretion system membrane fusion protein